MAGPVGQAKYAAQARAACLSADEPSGPFEPGERRVLVTVITRHQIPGPLSLARVTDLSRYTSSLDGDIAALREELRQRIRDGARQGPPSP